MSLGNDEFHVLSKMAKGRTLFLNGLNNAYFMGAYQPEEIIDLDIFTDLRMHHLIQATKGSTQRFPAYQITEAGVAALRQELHLNGQRSVQHG